ncbi:MAG TPA: hypothetical protein H9796_07400 [Candidatus Butyricimonas faecavium]|nr:hypothetical protein [Candidatus Butyricimonas faecavium]
MCIKKILSLFLLWGICFSSFAGNRKGGKEYVIVANQSLVRSQEWSEVISYLRKQHEAEVVYYLNSPSEVKEKLQRLRPRYVAFVERPEQIGLQYVLRVNRMSREIDEDMYVDFRWGIITGYDAAGALRLVKNARNPLIIRSALSTTTGVKDSYFDNFALISDSKDGEVIVKTGNESNVDTLAPEEILSKFCSLYETFDPDAIFTASHATEQNLEMPYSRGNIKSENGKLYAVLSGEKIFFKESRKPRVYFPVGNCLIGNVNNTRESMAIAWLNSADITGMLAYVVPTWYGVGGWGTLKVWMDSPGQYSLADAFFINMQLMQLQLEKWNPAFKEIKFPHETIQSEVRMNNLLGRMIQKIVQVTGIEEPTKDHLGTLYDEDVMVYFGDPKWDVRLQAMDSMMVDYSIDFQNYKKRCVLTLITENWFDSKREIPCSFIFPYRLNRPRLVSKENIQAVLTDDFILLYNLEPGRTYRLEIEIDK